MSAMWGVMLAVALGGLLPGSSSAQPNGPNVIKLGTLAQEGTPWADMAFRLNETIKRVTGGRTELQIYPGGILGDEPDLVQKLRIGQLQAVGLTMTGLSHIDDGVMVLHVPLLYQSFDELDAVRERMTPDFEADFLRKGLVLLCWNDVGWVYFFSKKPVRTVDDLRKTKLFLWAGDTWSESLYRTAGFRPVPMPIDQILVGLETGMIDAFDTVPLMALSYQWFGSAPYMTDLRWVPVSGGIVITNEAWRRIPAAQRSAIKAAARAQMTAVRKQAMRMEDDAMAAMARRGLNVVKLDASTLAAWHKWGAATWPRLRGIAGPAKYYDEALRLLAEERRQSATPSASRLTESPVAPPQ